MNRPKARCDHCGKNKPYFELEDAKLCANCHDLVNGILLAKTVRENVDIVDGIYLHREEAKHLYTEKLRDSWVAWYDFIPALVGFGKTEALAVLDVRRQIPEGEICQLIENANEESKNGKKEKID